MAVQLDTLISLCKRRGFIFQSSEIYGGMAACYDYGPLGVELKRNVRNAWWRAMVQERADVEGIECSILMHPDVWRTSGHVENFTDPLVDCKSCRGRFRADHVANYRARYRVSENGGTREEELGPEIPSKVFRDAQKIEFLGSPTHCPTCGNAELTAPRLFNLLFKTNVGPIEDASSVVFMRPETAQGMFVNFENVRGTMRRKLPFGIAQIGRSFRNEITTKAFIFRTLEFEQMEMEFFCKPGTDEEWYRHWVAERFNWYLRYGIRRENLRLRQHDKDELAHYSRMCHDVEYNFPMGWGELEGIAHRGDYDLSAHMKATGKDLQYFDPETNTKYTPYVIEPAAGVDRTVMTFLIDAYAEETVLDRPRTVLRLHPALAPIKVAVLPLLKKRGEIVEICQRLVTAFKQHWPAVYDDTAAIGKLYRRQDEVGTPYCVTVDVDSLEDGKATVRERDTMEQERIELDRLEEYLTERIVLAPPKVEERVEV
ncbi:MAG TPA: glycine--tRNA ligase [Candidatus Sumerlaeota bacterium]|nr:glycine--tRNA ligase [Candidatus Sumerlaeota bacterium]